eukprot:TRINITY_DN28929_c0_g1_i1.p1 TRINITY_DN28929_c0_g1~~TRINITY_DN28929_c0_g1_i1.p1  ORF type:complete len:324 (-),score=28.66 TRINITY_DN28929_c0_g1_i1:177-1148(-)
MTFKGQRWTLANTLPLLFTLSIIGTIWSLYVGLHLRYVTQACKFSQLSFVDEYFCRRGIYQAAISQFLTLMVMICFVLAVLTDPGSVPENAKWMPDLASSSGPDLVVEEVVVPPHNEVKHSGAPRFCRWCNCFKPDRCHHCRVCRSCTLRMDHHCPWIVNCVGFRNYKHFLLLGVYSVCACAFIIVTMSESMNRVLVEETTFIGRFLMVFGMTLTVIMGNLWAYCLTFHIWLVASGTTTIEVFEKSYKLQGQVAEQPRIYDRGKYRNICDVLGSSPLVWLIPFVRPNGDGLHFQTRRDLTHLEDPEANWPSPGRPLVDSDSRS